MEDEEDQWTAHLIDVEVPDFQATSGVNVKVNNPTELDGSLYFAGDDLSDNCNESNRYLQ